MLIINIKDDESIDRALDVYKRQMVGLAIFQPVIGGWLDTERSAALASGLSAEAAELAAGQATLDNIAIFPAILVVIFGALFVFRKKLRQDVHPETVVGH